MRKIRSCEAGLTLPELMITIAILGIVITALSGALIAGLKNDRETTQRFSESRDLQLLSIYLPPDVQSATTVVPFGSDTGGCSGGAEVVAFQWQEQLNSTSPITRYAAAYRIVAASGESQLVRYFCDGSGTEQLIVAHTIEPGCPPSACFANQNGKTVSLQLKEESGFSYSISGTQRADP